MGRAVRIAAVQHGDYLEAARIIESGQPEPYFGMGYTVRTLDALFSNREHLVISLDAPAYNVQRGSGRLVGLPHPMLSRWMPGTLGLLSWAERINRQLEAFQPTHLLLRTSWLPAWWILRRWLPRGVSVLVVFANTFGRAGVKERWIYRHLVQWLNHPGVFLVGNHRQPATDSMLAYDLNATKAVPWDWPGGRLPQDYPPKTLDAAKPAHLLYVGNMIEAKGVGDLIDAVELLHQQNLPVRLTCAGEGKDMPMLRAKAERLPPEAVELLGRVGNDRVFELMLESTLVCVPSRHTFSEGMPLTLTEALATRTPVIASDHPVMARAFEDGQGLRIFKASDPSALAGTLQEVLRDPDQYAQLSRTTADAYARVACPTTFGDLIDRWVAHTFPPSEKLATKPSESLADPPRP